MTPTPSDSAALPASSATSSATRNATPALFVALAVWALLAWRFDFLVDDAFISFRYARHLVEGEGLRFNPGETTPVEGFTNLGWVLALAPFERSGLPLAFAARALSLTAAAALLVALASALRRLSVGAPAVFAALLFLASLPPFAVWSTGGLETMAFALSVFLIWERLSGDAPQPWQAGLAAACAALLRADGPAVALMVLGAVAAAGVLRGRRERIALALRAALPLLAATALLLVWRRLTFGGWLPHTAHNKVELSPAVALRGARYVAALTLAVPTLLLALALGARALVRTLSERGPSGAGRASDSSAATECVLVLVGAAAYGSLIGGDWMPFGRYLVFALPFAAVLVGLGLDGLTVRVTRALAALLVLLSLASAFDVHVLPRALRERVDFRYGLPAYRTEVELWSELAEGYPDWVRSARALGEHVQRGDSMPYGAVGIPGYFTELVLYDTWGLTGLEAADSATPRSLGTPGHDRWVGPEHFLSRRPTYYGFVVCPAEAPLHTGLGAGYHVQPLGRLLEVERHALEDGSGDELRLFRLHAFDLVPEPLVPLLDGLTELAPRAVPEAPTLDERLPADGPQVQALSTFLAELPLQTLPGGLAVRRLAVPPRGQRGWLVDLWSVDAGASLPGAQAAVPSAGAGPGADADAGWGRVDLVLEGARVGWRSADSPLPGPARVVTFAPGEGYEPRPPR